MRRIYRYFYSILPIKKQVTGSSLVILTNEEVKQIKTKERIAIWLATFFGAMGVILLYVPYYAYHEYFSDILVELLEYKFNVPIIFFIYVGIMVGIELFLLTLLHIWCTHEVAALTGFINPENKHQLDKRKMLINISLEKKNKSLLEYGIDPYQGLNRGALLAWNAMILLKATLSNLAFKFIIQRVLGRYALQAVQDFAGIPIFAAWNAFGTKRILRESRVIIMGENVVSNLASRIRYDQEITADFKYLLYQTLRYIAVSKRDFHQNHYLLAKHLFELYNITPLSPSTKKEYLLKVKEATPHQQNICRLLITIGYILDGDLSTREQIRIKEMRKEGIFDFTIKEMKQFNQDFVNGKGVEKIITTYIKS